MNYDKIDAMNWSTLKLMSVSPAWARHSMDHPEESEDKPAFVTGRAVHAAILEPDRFAEMFMVQPKFDRRTKVGKQGYAEFIETLPDGAQLLSQPDYDMAVRCADEVRSRVDLLDGAKCELPVTWTTSGVKCKGRVDAIADDRVIDLKTTRQNELGQVERTFANYDYHGQLAWYHDGAVKAGLISGDKPPIIVAIHASTTSTFVDLASFEMVGGTLAAGRAKYQKLLAKYIGCKQADWWPGMASGLVQWVLPEWKMMRDMDEEEIQND